MIGVIGGCVALHLSIGFLYFLMNQYGDPADIVLWPMLLCRGFYRRFIAILRGEP
jgi:hypothetical protein